jgi:VanZ family protein
MFIALIDADERFLGDILRRFATYQLPLILYAVLILTVSSITRLPTPDIGITFLDKVAHLAEYFIFIWLALRAFSKPPFSLQGGRVYGLAISVSILFAAFDEYYQSFVPGREADFVDWLFDILGTLLGAVAYFRMAGKRRIRHR